MTQRGEGNKLAPIPGHVEAMETALSLLHAAARAVAAAPASTHDLRALGESTKRATARLLDAYDARGDALAKIRDAMVACDQAEIEATRLAQALEGLADLAPWFRGARDWMHAAEQAFERQRPVSSPARDIAVSQGTPALQRLDRACVAPVVRAPPVLPPAAPAESAVSAEIALMPPRERIQKLREHAKQAREAAAGRRDARAQARAQVREASDMSPPPPRPGFTKGAHAAISVEAFVRNKARELFEDVAAMGALRAPQLGDHWRGPLSFEQRMLRDLDAFGALGGPALAHVEQLVADAPSKDDTIAFAAAMICGCFEGRDTLAALDRCLRFVGLEEAPVRDGAARALSLVPHPDLRALLGTWKKDAEPAFRALAFRVLAARGWLDREELVLACGDHEELVASTVFVPAALLDIPDLAALIEQRKDAKTRELREALAWANVLGSTSYPLDKLRAKLDVEEESELVLVPFALAAEEADAAALVDRFARHPTRTLALALGYAGHPAAIAPLVAVLEREVGPELKTAVSFALQRLTGAEIYREVEIPAEKLEPEMPDDPPLPDGPPPLARLVGDRRDRPGRGAPDRMTLPSNEPEDWRAFLTEQGPTFEGKQRLRRGKPYTPALSLLELDSYQITPLERQTLHREIVIKTGVALPFDTNDFIATQALRLEALAAPCQRASSHPGAWGRALRQRGTT